MVDSKEDIFKKTVKWEELAPLPVCRNAHTAVLLGGNVYVGGGFDGRGMNDFQDSYRLDVYNLTTNQWSSSPIITPYCWFAMTVLDDKLLVTAGGATKSDEVVKNVLVLNAGQWKDYSEIPTARSCATAVGYHSMLIVVGGRMTVEGITIPVTITELLDTTNGCWHRCKYLPSPHQQMKAAIMNGKLYLLGGYTSNNSDIKLSPHVFLASLDTLSTHQLNWQSAPSTPWCASASVVLYNKFLLTVGGRKSSGYTGQISEVYALNPSTGHWRHLTNIPAARSFPGAVIINDKMMVIGGMTSNNKEYSNRVWIGVFEK